MNLVDIYVSNISSVEYVEQYDVYKIVADTDCCGNKKKQVSLVLPSYQYEDVKKHGKYVG